MSPSEQHDTPDTARRDERQGFLDLGLPSEPSVPVTSKASSTAARAANPPAVAADLATQPNAAPSADLLPQLDLPVVAEAVAQGDATSQAAIEASARVEATTADLTTEPVAEPASIAESAAESAADPAAMPHDTVASEPLERRPLLPPDLPLPAPHQWPARVRAASSQSALPTTPAEADLSHTAAAVHDPEGASVTAATASTDAKSDTPEVLSSAPESSIDSLAESGDVLPVPVTSVTPPKRGRKSVESTLRTRNVEPATEPVSDAALSMPVVDPAATSATAPTTTSAVPVAARHTRRRARVGTADPVSAAPLEPTLSAPVTPRAAPDLIADPAAEAALSATQEATSAPMSHLAPAADLPARTGTLDFGAHAQTGLSDAEPSWRASRAASGPSERGYAAVDPAHTADHALAAAVAVGVTRDVEAPIDTPEHSPEATTITMDSRTVKFAAWMLGLTAGFGFITMVCAIWGLVVLLRPPAVATSIATPTIVVPAAPAEASTALDASAPAMAVPASAASAAAAARHHHHHKIKPKTAT